MNKHSEIKFKQNLLDKEDSRLELTLEGSDINHVVVNTLRRVGMTDVPIYSFDQVDISENKSVFNNDYMRLRIRTLPITNIENDNVFVDDTEKKLENNFEDKLLEENANIAIGQDDIDYNEVREVVSDAYDMITLFLDKKNTNEEILNVTTDDCKFYKNGEQIKNIYNDPLLLIKLKQGDKIKLSAVSKLGKESMSSLYSAVSILTYQEITPSKFKIILESRGQISEYRVLYVACQNIIKKMDSILSLIPKNNDKMEGEIHSNNLDHTYGNLLVTGLLRHNDVDFAGYSKPHLLDNKIVIKYTLKKNNIFNVITDVTDYYKKLYESLSKHFDD